MAPRRQTPLIFTAGGPVSPTPTSPAPPDNARPEADLAETEAAEPARAAAAEAAGAEPGPAAQAPPQSAGLAMPLHEPEQTPAPKTAVAAATSAPLAPALAPGAIVSRLAEPEPSKTGIYITAAIACVLWAGAVGAFAFGYISKSGLALAPLTVVFLTLLAIAPMGLILAGAYVVAQARTLTAEARRAKRLTDELIGPTALAAAQTGAVVEAMRGQIATATEVANQAREHLTALRQALAMETERLAEATSHASRTAVGLVETLSRERGELNTLALTLDARSAAVTDAINRQAHMVAEASDLAETQLREAEAALAARAADLAAAAGEAVDASRVATEDLGRQVGRLETASGGVGDQMRALEDGLTQQRAALVTVAHALRAEQEDFATLAESRTAQLAEFVASARKDVTDLNEATTIGAGALSELINAAGGKFRELAQAAGAERDAFAKSAEGTLKDLSEAGAREREHLESAMRSTIDALSAAAVEAREAADVHAEAARARVDLLNEAAFTAGQKADQVFDNRLDQARGLIEQSARLVEEAGDTAVKRLETQVAAARTSLDGLNAMMDEVTARAARLPAETGAKADEIRTAVQQGLDELLASARKAAEETQAIDQAFQERVRRNYEMLSEAVQLMGVVAQGGQGASVLQRASPADRARSRVAAAQTQREAAHREAPPPAQPEAKAPEVAAPSDPQLRGRLKLTPTATDDEFKAAFDAAGGRATADEGGWTWKELLNTLGDSEAGAPEGAAGGDATAPVDLQRLGELMFNEIEGMAIDPSALLSRGRIEEIAAAVQTGDAAGAREVVRTLAPAAIRRIARRMLSDSTFRARVQTLIEGYRGVVAAAVQRDKQGYEAAAALATKPGRAYLLLDAAASGQGVG
ncbi:MAG TPA: polar localization protein TipN [Caulobacteraceae bacterium]|nr:polar localization protein TipN [Caulobacteraceae bacterium]